MRKIDTLPYTLVLPALFILSALQIYPILRGIILSFYDIEFAEKAPFCGFNNYARMIHDPSFWHSVKITIIYTMFCVVGVYFIALLTALLLNNRFRGRTIAKVFITLPWAVPQVVACLVWRWIFDYQYGVLNYLVLSSRLIRENVGWLTDPSVALLSVLVVTVWKIFPLTSLVLLAGLQSIPHELYEAAEIDGATKIDILRYVTLPHLKPLTGLMILLVTIWSFKRFAIIWVLTQGGPLGATTTIVLKVYESAFRFFEMGYGATIGVAGFLFSIMITLIYFCLIRREW